MNPGPTSSAGYVGNAALGQAETPTAGMTDRLGYLLNSATETHNLLCAQHERLFGAVPARPEPMSPPKSGQPSAMDGIDALDNLMDGISHVTRAIARRI